MSDLFVPKYNHFKSLSSTNEYLKNEVRKGRAEEGLVVTADIQTKGKGQRSKTWASEEGQNLLFSILLNCNPKSKFNMHPLLLSQMVSVGVAKVLQWIIPDEEVVIKWPNDILVGSKKIAGILIENVVRKGEITHSVVGVGVNVNQDVFPNFERTATSIVNETKKNFKTEDLSQMLANKMSSFISDLENRSEINKEFNSLLYLRNSPSEFKISGKKVLGTIKSCRESGELILEHSNGRCIDYLHGELGFTE